MVSQDMRCLQDTMHISIFYLYVHNFYYFIVEDHVNNIERSYTLETRANIIWEGNELPELQH